MAAPSARTRHSTASRSSRLSLAVAPGSEALPGSSGAIFSQAASPTTNRDLSSIAPTPPKQSVKHDRSAGETLNVNRPLARSADRNTVLQTALCPERVKAALDLERRTLADVALKDFAVVAHVLDDLRHPVVGQASCFAEFALCAEEMFDLRIVRLRHLV